MSSILIGKIHRTLRMLFDNSEIFNETPNFRWVIIKNIWKIN